MDIFAILLDILLKPPQPFIGLFLLILNESAISHSMVFFCVSSRILELHVLEDFLHSLTNH